MTKREIFGEWIKAIRKDRGLSLGKVSKMLGYKTRGTMGSVEMGYTCLPLEKIHPLARIYEIPLEEILEKIREAEPELYRKYEILSRDIIEEFTRKVAGLHNARYRSQGDPEYILYDLLKRTAQFAVHPSQKTVHSQKNSYLRGVSQGPPIGTQLALDFNSAKEVGLSLSAAKPTEKRNPEQLNLPLQRRLPANVFRIGDKRIPPPRDPGPRKARVA